MSKKIRIHASPLTGTIFAGVPLKNGLWGKDKSDVTDDAFNAVATSMLFTDQEMDFQYEGVNYTLKVVRSKK